MGLAHVGGALRAEEGVEDALEVRELRGVEPQQSVGEVRSPDRGRPLVRGAPDLLEGHAVVAELGQPLEQRLVAKLPVPREGGEEAAQVGSLVLGDEVAEHVDAASLVEARDLRRTHRSDPEVLARGVEGVEAHDRVVVGERDRRQPRTGRDPCELLRWIRPVRARRVAVQVDHGAERTEGPVTDPGSRRVPVPCECGVAPMRDWRRMRSDGPGIDRAVTR